jgi:hypothetical protein
MDMDDNDRLARLEQKIDGIERKIDDLSDGLRRFAILAISVVLAWVVADIISGWGGDWIKEHGWFVGIAFVVTFIVVGATLTSKFNAKDRGRDR